jgi:NADH:ubiquinone oxidoreductase subunit F (NADH-binding)
MQGDVNNHGLIEAPMGTTLREIIEIYGGGMKGGKKFKCAQTGGSSGSIIRRVCWTYLWTSRAWPSRVRRWAAVRC